MLDHIDKNNDTPTTPGTLKVVQKPLWHLSPTFAGSS